MQARQAGRSGQTHEQRAEHHRIVSGHRRLKAEAAEPVEAEKIVSMMIEATKEHTQ